MKTAAGVKLCGSFMVVRPTGARFNCYDNKICPLTRDKTWDSGLNKSRHNIKLPMQCTIS